MVNAELIFHTLAASVATVSFSCLFGVPPRYYPYCGLIGGTGWLIYLILQPISSSFVASLVATMAVMLMSRWFAVVKRCPVTIFLISGIIPLVPGAGIYWAAYYAVLGRLPLASYKGFEALEIVAAIVLGIVFVFELPERLFHGKGSR